MYTVIKKPRYRKRDNFTTNRARAHLIFSPVNWKSISTAGVRSPTIFPRCFRVGTQNPISRLQNIIAETKKKEKSAPGHVVELHSIHTQSNSPPYRTNFLLTHFWSAPIIRFSLCIYTHPPKKKRERVYLTHRFCTRSKQTRHTHTHTCYLKISATYSSLLYSLPLLYRQTAKQSAVVYIFISIYLSHSTKFRQIYNIFISGQSTTTLCIQNPLYDAEQSTKSRIIQL